jgi:hypothetical protein
MLDQTNLSTQRCRLIFWLERSVGGYLVFLIIIFIKPKHILSFFLILVITHFDSMNCLSVYIVIRKWANLLSEIFY